MLLSVKRVYPTIPALILPGAIPATAKAIDGKRRSNADMTGPPPAIFGLYACPLCSYLRADHPELLNDVLALPTLWQGRAGKLWYLSDRCHHGADLFGPYQSEAAAKGAWNARVECVAAQEQEAKCEAAA